MLLPPARLFVLVFMVLSNFLTNSDAADSDTTVIWPQWRGPHRDAKFQGAQWPDSLGEDRLKQSWRVELGPSYSGPIVAEDRIFVTETLDKKSEVVRAIDRSTGQERWRVEWDGAVTVPFFAASNGSWIRATPAYDGERLYVAGMRDRLVCLESKTGRTVWEVDFVQAVGSPVPDFGFVSSPLVVGDHVYVQAGASLAKLDKRTGQILWQTLKDEGGMWGSVFSSPLLTTIDQTPQLLVQTRAKLAGVDPDSGHVLWQRDIPAFRGMNILTPTMVGNSIFTSSYGGRSLLLTPTRSDSGWQLEEAWTNKTQGYMSTPVIIDGQIYLHLRNQRFVCIDAQTGKERWTTKPFGKYWSMVANGDRILALDQRGELLLIRANPEQFELLDRRKIAEDTWAHLAVCGNEVFVRELNAMAAFDWQ